MLTLDIETTWMRHDEALPTFVVAGYAYDDGPVRFTYDANEVRGLIDFARHGGHEIVMHRGAFETGVLGIRGLDWYDTAMVATIAGAERGDPDVAGHSLLTLAQKAGYPKYAGKKTVQASFLPGMVMTHEQIEYLTHDVQATRAVAKWQKIHYPQVPDLERQTRWSANVFALGRRGLHIDLARLAGLLEESGARLREHSDRLKACGIIQPRGPKKDPWRKSAVGQAEVQRLLQAAGVTEHTGEDGDGEFLVRDSLTLRKTNDPKLRLLADYYREQKWLSLLEAYNVDGGVVRARYNSLVATGRMSASSPNVQQVTKKGGLRECWVPRPGHVLLEADYAMLELYTFADTCARWNIRSRLREALNEGVDVHTLVAQRAGIDRQLAKVFNYGGLGGMGAATMQANIEKQLGIVMPVDDIRDAMDAWLEVWPEVREYWQHNVASSRFMGWKVDPITGMRKAQYKYLVTNPQSGRRRLAFYCAAQNFGFQGPGGDIIKRALELTDEAGVPAIAALHDQLIADVPLSQRKAAAVEMARCMKQAGEEICPNVRWPEVQVHTYATRWASK